MNATTKARHWMVPMGAFIALVSLALAACSSEHDNQAVAPVAAGLPASAAVAREEEPKCTNEPRTVENDKRPRCEGPSGAKPDASRAYRFVGGSGDPVDQVVCDISETFVLDGKLFGVELSGGVDGTYKFVRTPNIPGLSWKAGGRYHIDFPDGPAKPGTLTTEGGGTTTAGAVSRETAGGERFVLTPVAECE